MIKYTGFIDIEGSYYNINAIKCIKRWNFGRHSSIIIFNNGDQMTVSEGLHSLMQKVTEAKEK